MPYTRASARKLLTASEYELFASSTTTGLREISEARLGQKIRRTRNLRDKYTDLLRRQNVSMRKRTGARSGASGAANARTREKQQIFGEMLNRFEKRLEQVRNEAPRKKRGASTSTLRQTLRSKRKAQAAQRAARDQKRSPKAPATKKKTIRRSAAGPVSERALAAQHAMRVRAANAPAIHGHVSASGRRAQARRDRRG